MSSVKAVIDLLGKSGERVHAGAGHRRQGNARHDGGMEPTAARYGSMADLYDATVGDSVSDPATEALLDLAGDMTGLNVVELACGQGRVARELARRGARVVGVDISPALLER